MGIPARRRGRITVRRSVVSAFLLCFLLTTPVSAQAYQLSSAQVRYMQAYGPPGLFLLGFEFEEIDTATKSVRALATPRRIEVWLYVQQGLRVVFDNGFFAKEARFDPRQSIGILPATNLKPNEFTANVTRQDIQARFGPPDRVESAAYGKRRFEVYRYSTASRGIKSFTFLNDRLAGVAAGFALVAGGGASQQPSQGTLPPQPQPPAIGGGWTGDWVTSQGYTLQGTTLRWFGINIWDNDRAHAICRAECAKDARCRAYSFVVIGGYNPNDGPVCYLLSNVQNTVPHRCCISGIKQ